MLLDTLHDVVTIPISAVQRGAPGTYVYLLKDDNTVSVHPITLGAQDGDLVAVQTGLEPGERVVTDGADRLRDGAKVVVPEAKDARPVVEGQPPNGRNRRRRGQSPSPGGPPPGAAPTSGAAATPEAEPAHAHSHAPAPAAPSSAPAPAPAPAPAQ
jgi:multidrug efflux system membrane fusion protein